MITCSVLAGAERVPRVGVIVVVISLHSPCSRTGGRALGKPCVGAAGEALCLELGDLWKAGSATKLAVTLRKSLYLSGPSALSPHTQAHQDALKGQGDIFSCKRQTSLFIF